MRKAARISRKDKISYQNIREIMNYEDRYVYACPGQILRLGFYLGRSWSPSLIASRSVSGADYPTSSPTKWHFKSERECPA